MYALPWGADEMSGHYIKPCPGVHLYLEVFWHVLACQVFTGIWQICNNTRRFYILCHPCVQETATVEPLFVIFRLILIVCMPFLKSMAWVLRGILLNFCLISSVEVFGGSAAAIYGVEDSVLGIRLWSPLSVVGTIWGSSACFCLPPPWCSPLLTLWITSDLAW